MTIEMYKALTEEQANMLLNLLALNRHKKEILNQLYDEEVKKESFICKMLEKRISVLKLTPFEPSALMFIDLLSEGNPGRAILMLIETLEYHAKENPKPSIDIEYLSGQVYPWGFYTEPAFKKEWDARKLKITEGYNFIIGPSAPPASTSPAPAQQEPTEPYRIVNWKD